ncbi:hypothetical protein AB205_0175560 [Aquarana catesbeiana]|uniref:Uncharacterized protein n=1 Tax=Aquarana catesbeiana TaxID=8400 RepID=A0A2G9S9E8_AQUCT|nr:hypothetical protein AB205_0175560 [Aquarana catesbeiana]
MHFVFLHLDRRANSSISCNFWVSQTVTAYLPLAKSFMECIDRIMEQNTVNGSFSGWLRMLRTLCLQLCCL